MNTSYSLYACDVCILYNSISLFSSLVFHAVFIIMQICTKIFQMLKELVQLVNYYQVMTGCVCGFILLCPVDTPATQ